MTDRLAQCAVIGIMFWAAHCAGVWDGPTPENIRKLDAEIGRVP